MPLCKTRQIGVIGTNDADAKGMPKNKNPLLWSVGWSVLCGVRKRTMEQHQQHQRLPFVDKVGLARIALFSKRTAASVARYACIIKRLFHREVCR